MSGVPAQIHDPRWKPVDDYAASNLIPDSHPYAAALNNALALSDKNSLPAIQVSALQGKFLTLQVLTTRATNVLELGTLGGYSSIWLASAAPEVKVTTIEVSPHHAAVAKEAIDYAGLSDRVEVLTGTGIDVLSTLHQEIKTGTKAPFDFAFIDADKPSNRRYLELVVPMCKPGTMIVVDNVVRQGKLASQEISAEDERVRGSREVVEAAGRDERLECTLLQTVGDKGYDGFLLCVVK